MVDLRIFFASPLLLSPQEVAGGHCVPNAATSVLPSKRRSLCELRSPTSSRLGYLKKTFSNPPLKFARVGGDNGAENFTYLITHEAGRFGRVS
jgi:hypothetical protein